MKHTSLDREALIQGVFDSMGTLKRVMYGQSQSMYQDCPIPRSQFELLFTIRHAQPVSFKKLASLLWLTPGAVSQLAEALEERQYIRRETSPDDRRIQALSLTKKGMAIIRDFEKERMQMMKNLVAVLSDEELKAWVDIQQKIMQQFQQTQPNDQTK